jgi:predicted alpha/beta-fold hydrolase
MLHPVPLIEHSIYRAPWWLPGGHLQTIVPAIFRRVRPVTTLRERLELDDGDFLDLAWSGKSSTRLAILSHGLEGSSDAAYIQGMARSLVAAGWDALAWNFRGCGTEPNRLLSFYHSGATEDLAAVIRYALAAHPAQQIDLIGFSLGGNLTLKYLGEPRERPEQLSRALAFSVPCDLADSAHKLSDPTNRLYMRRFLRSLRAKLRVKESLFPGSLDLAGLDQITDFLQFDDRFTAPLHGFRNAEDYWTRSSCRQYLPHIRIPTLLVNALNDPFLGERCYPREEARESEWFHLETPDGGGHVTFPSTNQMRLQDIAADFLMRRESSDKKS